MRRFRRTRQFKKQYRKLPPRVQQKLKKQLRFLAEDFQHPSLNARKMAGTDNIWEGRVDYQYRFTFSLVEETIVLRAVGTHKIYQNP